MSLNLNMLSPIRESAYSDGASRRRKERDKERKSPARRESDQAEGQAREGQQRGQGLNAYA